MRMMMMVRFDRLPKQEEASIWSLFPQGRKQRSKDEDGEEESTGNGTCYTTEKERMATQRKLHKTAKYKSSIEETKCVQTKKEERERNDTHAMTPERKHQRPDHSFPS
jgi:hypothetical protein